MNKLLPYTLILVLLVSLALPEGCLACSCVIPPPDQAPARVDIVFRGQLVTFSRQQVIRYRSDGASERVTIVRATFLVETSWKGALAPVVSTYSAEVTSGGGFGSSTCAASLREGRAYLVFASRGRFGRDYPTDLLSTSWCSGTREADTAGAYLTALGPGRPVAQATPTQDGLAAGMAIAAFDLAASAERRGAMSTPSAPPDRLLETLVEFGLRPSAIATDRQGNVYVADVEDQSYQRHRVLKYSPSGTLLARWGGAAVSGPGQFLEPRGIAVDRVGYVYVADRSSGVQKLDPTGQPVPGWPARTDALNGIQFPSGLATDEQDNLYIVDVWGNTLHKFSAQGEPLATWGAQGDGPGQFRSPSGIAVDTGGNIYVADTGNNRVQKFSPLGTFLLQWGPQGAATREDNGPYGLAIDRRGNLYIADRWNSRVQQFAGDGRFIGQWGGEGSGPGQFRGTWGVAAGPTGEVYVADLANYRVQRIPASRQP